MKIILMATGSLVLLGIIVFVIINLNREVTLCSGINGSLIENGQVLPNAKIQLEINSGWFGKSEFEVLTDKEGKFSFPPLKVKGGLGNILPHEPHISQNLWITSQDQKKLGYYHSKSNYSDTEFSSLQHGINLDCDFAQEKKLYQVNDSKNYAGICRIKDLAVIEETFINPAK